MRSSFGEQADVESSGIPTFGVEARAAVRGPGLSKLDGWTFRPQAVVRTGRSRNAGRWE